MCVVFKQKTAFEMRISDWSSDVCSSDLLPPHMATFVQRFPGVGFELQVGNTAGIGHAIAEGRIDVAFVEGVVDDPGIVATPWRDEPLQVAGVGEPSCRERVRSDV